jgi:hypothetical protein
MRLPSTHPDEHEVDILDEQEPLTELEKPTSLVTYMRRMKRVSLW